MSYIKNIFVLFIFLSNIFVGACYLERDLAKLMPSDREKRLLERWLFDAAPRELGVSFDGKDEKITLNWAGIMSHILELEILCKKGSKNCTQCHVAGFHHDYQGHIKKSGLVEFSNIIGDFKNGIYHAEITYKGMSKESTFFPRDWDRKKVAQSIITAFKNAWVEKYTTTDFLLVGIDSEGYEIGIGIQRDGYVRSAFPLQKNIII